MPLQAGLADQRMALAVVPAAAGQNHGICMLASLHSTIIYKTPLTSTCLLASSLMLHFLIMHHTFFVSNS